MTKVISDIYRLKIPLPSQEILSGFVNVYLVRGNNGGPLVDNGWDTEEALKDKSKTTYQVAND